MKRSLLVTIATFNRPQLLWHTLRSISMSRLPEKAHIHLFDDMSTSIPWDQLTREFPFVEKIHYSTVNRGPDGNILNILHFFNRSEHSHLLFLDSDCLVREDVFETALKLIDEPGIIWSLYRSCFHSEKRSDLPSFARKSSLGALGMLLSHSQVANFLARPNLEPRSLDWQIVFFFRQLGAAFYVPLESRIEHIGWYGTHNSIGFPDRALGFKPTNSADAAILEELQREFDRSRSPFTTLINAYKIRMNSIWRFRIRSTLRRFGL